MIDRKKRELFLNMFKQKRKQEKKKLKRFIKKALLLFQ